MATAKEMPTPTPTGGGGCPHKPDGTTPKRTATASLTPTAAERSTAAQTPPFTPTPTAIAVKLGETPDGEVEVTSPDGELSNIRLYDLDVGDDPPLPGGPGGITRSEVLGQQAASQTLVEGGDFHRAIAAADPFLNACDSRDAVRLAAFQLGIPLPDTGGPALVGLIAAALLLGTGLMAWRLGVGGRW